VRGSLRAAPRADVEVLDPRSWSGRDALRRVAVEDWLIREPTLPDELSVYYKTPAALTLGEALIDLARAAEIAIRRLSVRRSERSFQVHLALPPTTADAGRLFEAVRALAQRSTG
jgi:hypothetical protein